MNNPRTIDNMTEKRLERVSRFCAIITAAWFFFGIFYTVRGVWFTASLCAAESVTLAALTFVALKYPKWRLLVANGALGLSVIGIVVESLFTGVTSSTTPQFLSCVGLMAAHQIGIRSAAKWTVIVIATLVVFHFFVDPEWFPILREPHFLEPFLVAAAVTVIIFAMSQQAEWTFDRYAKKYIAATESLEEQADLLRLAEKVAKVGHWRCDSRTGKFYLSKEAIAICGFNDEYQGNLDEEEFLHPLTTPSRQKLTSILRECRDGRSGFEVDLQFRTGHATRFAKYIGFSRVNDHQKVKDIFGVIKDETDYYETQEELNQKAEALRDLAEFDQLTGVANRRTFHTQLEEAAGRSNQQNSMMALLLIDLNGFKGINDTMGHAAGDKILKQLSRRLQNIIADFAFPASVARLGGDEFTIILEQINGEKDIEQATDTICWAISQSYTIDHNQVRLGASIGAAIYPTHTSDLIDLLSFADTAMYDAKSVKSGLSMYSAKMTEEILKRREIETRLHDALTKNEFFLVYQPQINAAGELCGVEALLRWRHQGEVISPAEFIPYLESSHGIHNVGRWVLFAACNQGFDWLEAGHRIPISVNISAMQFRHLDFVQDVEETLTATQLPPELLDLEITETVIIEEMQTAEQIVNRLKALGAKMSIDDFGTGYSSLSYLKHLPVDRLKIDRAFIKDYPDNDDGTLARTIVGLAHGLNMSVIAEGVETDSQIEFLRENGCDAFQGFAFSRPVPPEEIEAMLGEYPIAQTELAITQESAVQGKKNTSKAPPLVGPPSIDPLIVASEAALPE